MNPTIALEATIETAAAPPAPADRERPTVELLGELARLRAENAALVANRDVRERAEAERYRGEHTHLQRRISLQRREIRGLLELFNADAAQKRFKVEQGRRNAADRTCLFLHQRLRDVGADERSRLAAWHRSEHDRFLKDAAGVLGGMVRRLSSPAPGQRTCVAGETWRANQHTHLLQLAKWHEHMADNVLACVHHCEAPTNNAAAPASS